MRAGGPARRRELGQHDLIDAAVVDRLVDRSGVRAGDLVLDIGAGHGPISDALLARGAHVVAVELDRRRASSLEDRYAGERRVTVVAGDALRVPLPSRPYSVVANPPFGITTPLLRRLLGRPSSPLVRVDVVLQHRAARALATPADPVALPWSPWWEIGLGPRLARRAFRPQPPSDAAVVSVRRRPAPLLPPELAPAFAQFVVTNQHRWAAPDRGARWWARRFRSRADRF